MNGFQIKTRDNRVIRFNLYTEAATATASAFLAALPFSRTFKHAKISGQEIWIDDAPKLDIIQENASVFGEPGEIVIGPAHPERNKITNCIGIFYGEGKLLDCGNIFGKVDVEDMELLQDLGEQIWIGGVQELTFEVLP